MALPDLARQFYEHAKYIKGFPPPLDSIGTASINARDIANMLGEVCRNSAKEVLHEFLEIMMRDPKKMNLETIDSMVVNANAVIDELFKESRGLIVSQFMHRGWDPSFSFEGREYRDSAFRELERERDAMARFAKTFIERYESLRPEERGIQKLETNQKLETIAIGSHVVLLIHGIRTQGEWAQRAQAILQSDRSIRVVPIRYEFFDIVRFLLPFEAFRRRPIRRVLRVLRDELSRQPRKLSVIAHSFGTYIVGRILEEETDIEIDRLILCGSIIPDDFDWARFKHRLGRGSTSQFPVINDCGIHDPWPVLAKSVTWGYGSSGRFGFGHGRVKDRFHPIGHSGFFLPTFIEKYWLPVLTKDMILDGELNRPRSSWWLSVLTVLKLRTLVLLLLGLGFLVLSRSLWFPPIPAPKPTESISSHQAQNDSLKAPVNAKTIDPRPQKSNPLAWWRLDKNGNDRANNINIGASSMKNVEPTTGYYSAKGDWAYRFNGVTSYMATPLPDKLKPVNITLEAWVNWQPRAKAAKMTVVALQPAGSGSIGKGASLKIIEDGRVSFSKGNDQQNGTIIFSKGALTPDWHHIAGSYDGVVLKVYRDGRDDSGACQETASQITISCEDHTGLKWVDAAQGNYPEPGQVYIGASKSNEVGPGRDIPNGDFFAGIIDEVGVYGRALLPEEIQKLARTRQ